MEVLKRGEWPRNTDREETCKRCDTVFKFNVPLESYPSQDQRDHGVRHVDCPVCGNSIYFNAP